AEVAGVGGENDVAAGEPHAEGLMAGRVTVGRHADNAAVAEEIVLAVDGNDVVPDVVVLGVEEVPRREVGVVAGVPFPSLDYDRGVGDRGVAARMVEVEVRGDEEADAGRVDAERREPRGDVVAVAELDVEEARRPAEPRGRVAAGVAVEAAVEQ